MIFMIPVWNSQIFMIIVIPTEFQYFNDFHKYLEELLDFHDFRSSPVEL